MKKHNISKICAFAAVLIFLGFSLFMNVAADVVQPEEGEFYLETTNVYGNGYGGKVFNIKYNNNSGGIIALSENNGELVVTTDKGVYSKSTSDNKMMTGSGSLNLWIADCPGTVEKIEFSEVVLLDKDGNPDSVLNDVVVYEDGETGFVYDFSGFSAAVPIIIAAVVLLFVFVIAAAVIIVLLVVIIKKKKSKPQVV